MSEEELKRLQEYNLEYLEAQQSEEIFGGDHTSAVELKYAEMKIEEMSKELINQDEYITKLKEEYANQLQQKVNKLQRIENYLDRQHDIPIELLVNIKNIIHSEDSGE